MEERVEAVIHAPSRRTRLRRGRGFSTGEIRKAGLILHEAKRLRIPIDKRRRTIHPQNVERLKERYGA